jgi:proline iminopeptidase
MFSPVAEGYIEVEGGRVWYRVAGHGDGRPLIVVHGGPGYPHDYLETLQFLASDRPVLFYDQLGCGNSDAAADPSLWRLQRFVTELATLRTAMGWPAFHLYGHSWGTIVALDYLLGGPDGIISTILASPAISIARWSQDAHRLCDGMPDGFPEAVAAHLLRGTTDSEDYQSRCLDFYRRHLCRLDPWPECMLQSFQKSGSHVYEAMWGPSEFHPTGTLHGYDRTAELGCIRVPVLYTCGRYDEASPEACAWYSSLTPGSQVAVFDESSHMPHLEQPDQYLSTLRTFLAEAERDWLMKPKSL